MKIPVFLSTCIVCPKCGSMIESLPSGMEEAITNGDRLECSRCKSRLLITISAAEQSVQLTAAGVESDGENKDSGGN